MLRDEGFGTESNWAGAEQAAPDCREIDRELRRIAKSRAAMDADEAAWLRKAEQKRIWRELGFSTALEYLEDVFGYSPRTALERLRVANALGELPTLERELREGALSFSAARELTRVATPRNEQKWLDRARGKNLRDIEQMVAGHKKGDDPDDKKDPNLIRRPKTFMLSATTELLVRQAHALAEHTRGEKLDEDQLMEALCRRFIAGDGGEGGDGGDGSTGSKPAQPVHKIHIAKCPDCRRAWQDGAGKRALLDGAALECAECDAQVVDLEDRSQRPTQTIPKRTRELVWIRDEGRCRVPGCRATKNLAFHHLRHRAHGGTHDAANICLCCDGHHKLLHDGKLTISGRAPDDLTFTRDGKPLVDSRAPIERQACDELLVDSSGSFERGNQREADDDVSVTSSRSRFGNVELMTMAKQALKQSGFKAEVAKRAVEAACAHVGTEMDLTAFIKQALRYCK